ncbi:MAG: PAS domain S-box protein [Bacillota bacterium]
MKNIKDFIPSETIHESEARYRMVFENSIDGIILISSEGEVIEANPAACSMTGMTEQEIIKLGRYGLVDLTDPRLPSAIEERSTTGSFCGELTYIRKDGTKFPVEITSKVFKGTNGKEMLYVFFRDITERKKYEESMRKHTIELETSNKIKDKTLSVISHDLRGPFFGFLGLTKELFENIDSLSKKDISEAASIIYRSAERTNELITNLFEWARLQIDNIEFQPELLNVWSEIDKTINLFYPASVNKSITIINKVQKDLHVLSDSHMLAIVLRNLLDNAIKFTPNGGIITFSAEKYDKSIEISIRDTGMGIAEFQLDKIFMIDSSKSTPGTSGEKGSGFGLALSSELLKKNKGNIKAFNCDHGGAVFTITLPSN